MEQHLPAGSGERWFLKEAYSHYYLSCWLMFWDRRGSLPVLWLAAWARRQPMQDSGGRNGVPGGTQAVPSWQPDAGQPSWKFWSDWPLKPYHLPYAGVPPPRNRLTNSTTSSFSGQFLPISSEVCRPTSELCSVWLRHNQIPKNENLHQIHTRIENGNNLYNLLVIIFLIKW